MYNVILEKLSLIGPVLKPPFSETVMYNLSVQTGKARDLSAQQLSKLGIIASLDFSMIKRRLVVDFPHYTPPQLDGMELEVKRFLALMVLEPNAPHRIVVSEKIDNLWHFFILHTREYRAFCDRVFGGYLNHVPILPEEKAELGPDYASTKELYSKYFGLPTPEFWGEMDMICWGGCDERVSQPEEGTLVAV